MEDIIDNIVYFIVLAAFIIIPALTKKKKKPVSNIPQTPYPTYETDVQEPVRQPVSILESLKKSLGDEVSVLDNLFDERIEEQSFETGPETYAGPEVEIKSPEEEGISAFADYSAPHQLGLSIQEDNTISMGDLTLSRVIEDGEIPSADKHPVLEDFDMKKAIIYTEIVNRKY